MLDLGTTAIKLVAMDLSTRTAIESLSYDIPHKDAGTAEGEQDPLLILRIALTGLKQLLHNLKTM